jgi:hypothetical protein
MSDFTSSVCLVTSIGSGSDQSRGTGFVIYQTQDLSYVLTCAHVLAYPETRVNEHYANVIVRGQDWLDIAVLEVKGLETKTPLKLGIVNEIGCSIKIPGIVKLQSSKDDLALRPLNGVLGEPLYPMSNLGQALVQAWDLRINEGEYLLREGYSGAPVIDTETGNAIAIVSHKAERGEKGIAISIQMVQELWGNFPKALLGEHQFAGKREPGTIMESKNNFKQAKISRLERDLQMAQDHEASLTGDIVVINGELKLNLDALQVSKLKHRKQIIEQEREEIQHEIENIQNAILSLRLS